jgi:hypothetical protein
MSSNYIEEHGQKIRTYGNEDRGHFIASVDSLAQLLHEGCCFDISGTPTLTANGGTYIFAATTGADTDVHFRDFEITSDNGPILIELIEDVTITDNGDAVATQNRNRQSTTEADMLVYTDATITGGSVISTRKITASAGGSHTEGGYAAIEGEWCLKRNANYAVRLTNMDTLAEAICSATFFFYEIDL